MLNEVLEPLNIKILEFNAEKERMLDKYTKEELSKELVPLETPIEGILPDSPFHLNVRAENKRFAFEFEGIVRINEKGKMVIDKIEVIEVVLHPKEKWTNRMIKTIHRYALIIIRIALWLLGIILHKKVKGLFS